MRFLITLAFMAVTAFSFAQDPADIYHKTIDLDSINEVSFDVYKGDKLEIKTWPGDDILVETSVKLNNGDPHILKFFLDKKRWDLAEKISGANLKLESVDKTRRIVQGTEFSTSETVVIVVYLPEEFEATGERAYRRVSR
ncbi:MAG: hypothetical protein ACI81P_000797 [Neolewinella sp.]|jgi:hypothetical protein